MAESTVTNTLTEEELAELKVRCLTLPVHGMTLMLPNTVIAEVAEYREPEKATNMPDWMLGMFSWRGKSVPIIAFEKLLGHEESMLSVETRFIVCNTLNGNSRIPFIALRVEGIPHLVAVDNSMLERDVAISQTEPAVLAYLRLQGESVIVPNIDVIEKMLAHLGITTG
jgi:chemosensory pili system protein ChpC